MKQLDHPSSFATYFEDKQYTFNLILTALVRYGCKLNTTFGDLTDGDKEFVPSTIPDAQRTRNARVTNVVKSGCRIQRFGSCKMQTKSMAKKVCQLVLTAWKKIARTMKPSANSKLMELKPTQLPSFNYRNSFGTSI